MSFSLIKKFVASMTMTTEGWKTPKWGLNRRGSLKVHRRVTILRFLILQTMIVTISKINISGSPRKLFDASQFKVVEVDEAKRGPEESLSCLPQAGGWPRWTMRTIRWTLQYQEENVFFRALPDLPLPPIQATCTTFFKCKKRRFKWY